MNKESESNNDTDDDTKIDIPECENTITECHNGFGQARQLTTQLVKSCSESRNYQGHKTNGDTEGNHGQDDRVYQSGTYFVLQLLFFFEVGGQTRHYLIKTTRFFTCGDHGDHDRRQSFGLFTESFGQSFTGLD